MAIRYRLTEKGLVAFRDSDGVGNSGVGVGSSVTSVGTLTADTTLVTGGVYTVSSSAVLTITLPDPTACPGCWLTLRSLSEHSHVLSASAVTAQSGTTTTQNVGAVVALDGTVGSSVAMISDGLAYLVMAQSGTADITG